VLWDLDGDGVPDKVVRHSDGGLPELTLSQTRGLEHSRMLRYRRGFALFLGGSVATTDRDRPSEVGTAREFAFDAEAWRNDPPTPVRVIRVRVEFRDAGSRWVDMQDISPIIH